MSGLDDTSYTTRTVATSTTLTNNDFVLLVLAATGAVTVTVPDARTIQPGRYYVVYKDAAAFAVTVSPAAGTIDGGASVTLAASAKHGVEIVSDGTNWFSIDSY